MRKMTLPPPGQPGLRMKVLAIVLAAFGLLLPPVLGYGQETVHHDLRVTLDPPAGRLTAEDVVTLPAGFPTSFIMRLHGNLMASSAADLVRIEQAVKEPPHVTLAAYRITLPPGQKSFTLRYSGVIDHPPETAGREYARGFQQTPGIISGDGVYLSGASLWYPVLETEHLSFSLQVALPPDWHSVSQGNPGDNTAGPDKSVSSWDCRQPQEEIFLIAAPYRIYTRKAGPLTAMVFLRVPDEKLADSYLDATIQYIALYEKLIGPYPYAKFALVENFWETGYGMPSFTLLGPKVIRFPFILHSSYPHEILHNWWGNSVYPDFSRGNWSEGLTAYLADHLIKEQQGGGTEYRQATLQKYADYAAKGRDFPLLEFTARHSSATEAVGYGKALMFFHMLRRQLSDQTFRQGLQHFYQHHRFRTASFAELRESFEAAAGVGLKAEFDQWLTRKGAPKLVVSAPAVEPGENGPRLRFTLAQTQAEPPYSLHVPVAVTMAGQPQAFQTTIHLKERQESFSLPLAATPLRLDIDPEFDLFRLLGRDETPPALSQGFGARRALIVLPASCPESLKKAYHGLAQAWQGSGPEEVQVVSDNEIEGLPNDEAVVLFGWENRFLPLFIGSLQGYGTAFGEKGLRISGDGDNDFPRHDHAFALASRHPGNPDLAFTWVTVDQPAAAAGLSRKLPHYHKYSYLVFQGQGPENIAKGSWPVLHSPLTVFPAGSPAVPAPMAELASRPALLPPPQP